MIRREIFAETQLTASAGVAPNKFLAKIASDWKKPNGIFVIRPHQIERFLTPLPVGRLPGVGKATEEALNARGIETVGQLRNHGAAELSEWMGKFGQRLYELAHGIDDRPVEPSRPLKSISSETTFAYDLPLAELHETVAKLSDDVWRSLTKKSARARTITVKLRDSRFRTETRRITLPATLGEQDELVAVARGLLEKFSFPEGAKFRLLGVGVSNFGEPLIENVVEEPQPLLFVAE
jgi:DNA polymerase-4